jgi:hypothetical protein
VAKGNGKHPVAGSRVPEGKHPRFAHSPDSWVTARPAWRVGQARRAGEYAWHTLSQDDLHDLHDRLSAFEGMTWQQIQQSAKSHFINVSTISKTAQEDLSSRKLDDVDQVFSLRLTGAKRVFGLLREGVLDILWWDPDHQVCPSNLKHT